MQETIEKLNRLQSEAFEKNDFSELKVFFQTPEYKDLSYLIRNRGFITSHKMQDFMRCEWCYSQKYINEVPDPTEGENEAFLIGQAIDDLLTDGETAFKNRYEIVARRAKGALKKQLTNGQGDLLAAMRKEFLLNKLFKHQLNKTIVFCKLGGFVLKAELDDILIQDRIMNDLKSTANITTFSAKGYEHQMSFYQLVVEEDTGVRCSANLEVVDKYTHFSRSGLFHFPEAVLLSNRGYILQVLEKMKLAHESGIFMPARDQSILYDCPYYGLKTNNCPDGHGRPSKPFII